MSVVTLSPQEKAALEQVAAGAVLQPSARRAQALLWLAGGRSIPDVAKSLAVSRQTVYNWLRSFQLRRRDADILASLTDKPRSGRPTRRPRMPALPTPEALDQMISSIINRDPRECGYRSILWTTMLLQQYLREVYSVKVTVAGVRSALTRLETRWQPVTVLPGEQYSHNEVV
jgi:transposase